MTTTSVTLTGTGIPHPTPGRAGPGALVRHGDVALQFDAGRGTVMRLADAGSPPHALTALFLTHIHSDHLVDLADVAMTRWIQQELHQVGPLTVVCPEGQTAEFVRRMFDVWSDDIAVRMAHVQPAPPTVNLLTFTAPTSPTEVWSSADDTVAVDAVAVHHEPVQDAVAYRVRTASSTVVVSGDTRVCTEVEQLAMNADVLVHEACRSSRLAEAVKGTVFERIFAYHADTVALGGMAQRAAVRHLLLTHLIPSPTDEQQEQSFARDVRSGGWTGALTVGRDLDRLTIGPDGIDLHRAG